MNTLTGKRALVCGSTQGIGRACAMELARQGAQIVLLARNRELLLQTREALPVLPDQAGLHTFLVADFTAPETVRQVVQSYLREHAGLHILVNNTGGPPGGPLLEATADDFLGALRAHLICNHYLAQLLVPGMRELGYGRIINIISTSVKQPIQGLGISNTTRWAVAGWAKTLANEVGRWGITVNNILPGATLTGRHDDLIDARAEKQGRDRSAIEEDMLRAIPLGRFAHPEETAAAVAFLASPAAGYISGINLPVDGGRTGSL
jgi:3-oxoacyl-[acyl-carrier protein] reductase